MSCWSTVREISAVRPEPSLGQIIARFHLVYRKEIPADAENDPAEEVPFTLWSQYLDMMIFPDHKTTPPAAGPHRVLPEADGGIHAPPRPPGGHPPLSGCAAALLRRSGTYR